MTIAVDLDVENQTNPQTICTKRKNRHFQDSKIVLKAYEASEIVDPKGGGQWIRTPLKNHNSISSLSNTGPDPLKMTKLPNQHSMSGHRWHASETPFKWRFAGGPLIVAFHSSLLN